MQTQTKGNIFDENLKTHSFNNVWFKVFDLLSENPNARILVVNCGVGYLVKYLMDRGFENVVGIDCHFEFISKGIELCPDLYDKIHCSNFFRLSEEEKNSYDFFIFVKTLEYLENDLQYIQSIPKNIGVLVAYPNYDDGLVLKHFDTKQGMSDYFEKSLYEIQISPITLYRNAEFMVDQAIFLLKGMSKG